MKRILFFFSLLPCLASAQVAKDTVTVLTIADIPAGAIRDTTNFTFVQDNAFKKATFDSLYKYTRVKLLAAGAITSAELATALSNETGTGAAVFATSPTLTTPNLGTPSAATLTNATGLPIATGLTGLGGINRIPYATSATALATSGDFIYNPITAQMQISGTENTAVSNTSFWNGNFIGLDIANNSTTTNTISGIRLRNGSNPVAGIAGIRESSTLTALGFFTGGSGVGGGTVPERMRITSSGNVGIGITPTKKLEVYGDLANGDGIQLTDASNGYIRIAQSTGSANAFAGMLSGQAVGDNPSFNLRGVQTATTPRTTATLQLQVANSTENGAIGNTDKAITFLNWATEMVTILGNGNFGIGDTNPSAVLELKAGTATANTAPLKFTSGTNLTTPEAGAMEYNGTNLFFTPSSTRHTINQGLTGSATLDFASTNAQNSRDLTITVTGAADGDVVSLGVPNAAVNANTCYTAWVSAANTVTVRFNNYSSGSVDPASGTFKVFVTKF